jgi:hypothetical protein
MLLQEKKRKEIFQFSGRITKETALFIFKNHC